MNADPRVMEYFPAPLTPEQSAEFMERIREEFSTEGFGLYAVERREDGELLGYTGLHRVTFTGMKDKIEIGWRLRAECWNQGYATEAAQACVALAAKLGIEELVAFTTVTNLRSQRVMQKLGMELLCEFDHPALPEGHPLRRHVLYLIGTENRSGETGAAGRPVPSGNRKSGQPVRPCTGILFRIIFSIPPNPRIVLFPSSCK